MRSILENVSAFDLTVRRGLRLETNVQTISATFNMPNDGPVVWQFNGGASDRIIVLPLILLTGLSAPNLPPANEGRYYKLYNAGTTNKLTINATATDGGGTVAILKPGEVCELQIISQVWVVTNFEGGGTSGTGVPLTNTAISTVGAGTLTAAALVGGVITRSGSTAAYTDTTDTAANIIAALDVPVVNTAWIVEIINTVAFTETLAAGTGVTLSGNSVIPPLSVGHFLLTYTGAGAVSMVGLDTVPLPSLPTNQLVTNTTSGATTAAVGDITGAQTCYLKLTLVAANNYTTRTAAQMFGDTPNAYAGMTWNVWIKNTNAGTTTVVGGTNVTITGTATIAQNTSRLFQCVFTDATHVAMESYGVTATV